VKKVVVEGYTDSVGSAEYNLELSRARAEAVKAYLVKRGIAPGRLDVQGFGATKFVAGNDTAAGREGNRRVEFVTKNIR
jgi:outer membrane protein OmpA-like peptidoglycan-associated protein